MDGIEDAREIKNRLGIPVLYLAASTDDEIFDRAKTTEPAGYISKPFREEDLHSNIKMALHKHRAKKKKANGSMIRNKVKINISTSTRIAGFVKMIIVESITTLKSEKSYSESLKRSRSNIDNGTAYHYYSEN